MYRDRSSDLRTTTTTTSLVGQVVLGARGPAAAVLPSPVALGPASIANPVRVPDASLRDVALFAQDEWRLRPNLSLIAGLARRLLLRRDRGDAWLQRCVGRGRRDAADRSGHACPDPNGASYARQALTGDVGLVANTGGRVSPFVRVGRSYRHPNLEEMLFAGPATVGSLVPNVTVKPETGRERRRRRQVPRRRGVWRRVRVREPVPRLHRAGPGRGDQLRRDRWRRRPTTPTSASPASSCRPMRRSSFRRGVLTLSGATAFTRGTITEGRESARQELARRHAVRQHHAASDSSSRRDSATTAAAGGSTTASGAQTEVTRVAETLLDSPFLIAQDLLSLDGFTVQRARRRDQPDARPRSRGASRLPSRISPTRSIASSSSSRRREDAASRLDLNVGAF